MSAAGIKYAVTRSVTPSAGEDDGLGGFFFCGKAANNDADIW